MWTMGAATLATLVLGLVARLARDTRSFFDASSLSSFPWAPGEQSIEPWAVLPVVLVALSSLVASRGRARLRAPLAVAAVLVAAAGWSPGLM